MIFVCSSSLFISPVDCIWGDYSWDECDKSCGGGAATGTRTYAQLAENGGQECVGEFTTTKSCNEQECPGMYPAFSDITPDIRGHGIVSGTCH